MESIVDKIKPLQHQQNMQRVVLDYFSALEFNAEQHKYRVNKNNLTSVSVTLKRFSEPFDADKIAGFVAKKRTREEGRFVSKEEVLAEWENKKNLACERGTDVHSFGETYQKGNNPKNGFEQAIVKFWDSIPDYIEPFLFELQMYSETLGIAGTADIILYNTKTGKFIIADYKGLPLNTDILTSEGWKTMGTLSKEDKVFDKEGNVCNIKNISGIHNKKCLKIKFDNNEEIISDFEHRWLVHKGNNKAGVVMTTQEIQNYLDSKTKFSSYEKLRIYNTKPIVVKDTILPIDPYVFGMWLGDGHKADGKITQMNLKVWEEIEKRGYILGPDVSQNGSGLAQTRTVYGLETSLRKLKLLKNKHLPEIFILSSYEQKLDVLRGLMDADGYYNKTRKRFVLTTTRYSQVEFSVQILASLGIKSTVIKAKKYCNNKVIDGYDICFTTSDFNPFLCRNEEISVITSNQNKYRKILSVKEVEQVPTKCIEVDSPSNTFLCTKSLIVTHNTNEDLFKNYKGKKLLHPFSDLLDNSYNKYQLQLSLYQLLFEQVGFEVESRIIVWLKPDGNYEVFKTQDYTQLLLNELITN